MTRQKAISMITVTPDRRAARTPLTHSPRTRAPRTRVSLIGVLLYGFLPSFILGLIPGPLLGSMISAGPGTAQAQGAESQTTPIHSMGGIDEYRLANGLRVLLCPDASRPTITVNVTYLVGSRHEDHGEAGMAHALEHLLGNGTEEFPALREAIEARGADWNATTWFDRTHFFETLTATDDNLDFLLRLEASRMRGAVITVEALARETEIISNEIEMDENDSMGLLSQRMLSAAYLWHGYRRTPIGNGSEIRGFRLDQVQRFYDHYYQPDNAVLVIAGRFDPDEALALVGRYFAPIPRPVRVLRETVTSEPPQDGPRRVTLSRAGQEAGAGLAYHVPAGASPDAAALEVLLWILTDAPAGRLYTSLVETGRAASVLGDGDAMSLAEPGVMQITAEVSADGEPDGVLETMIRVVEGLESFKEREVERAKARRLKKLRRLMADSSELAVELSEWIAVGDWRLFFIHRESLAEVTVADVERVARQYLIASNRTAGLLEPVAEVRRAEMSPPPPVDSMITEDAARYTIDAGEPFAATPEAIKERTLRFDLEPGLKVALVPKRTRGQTVRGVFRFHFGNEEGLRGRRAAMWMLADLLMRGTRERDALELRDAIDLLQADITLRSFTAYLGATLDADRAHLSSLIELLAEILRRPGFARDRFEEEQFEIVRQERLAKLQRDLADPIRQCFSAMRRGLYPWPEGGVRHNPTIEEEIAQLEALTLADVRDLHDRFIGAGQVEVSLVGDFDSGEVMVTLGSAFKSWRAPVDYERIATPYRPIRAESLTILTPDKPMAIVAMATLFELRDDEPEFPALEIAGYILGGSTTARLPQRLRHRDGLSYHATSDLEVGTQDRGAYLYGYAFCSPDKATAALDALREEIRGWIDRGVTEAELAAARTSYAREFEMNLADDAFVAGELARGLELDRSIGFHTDLRTAIEELTADEVNDTLRRVLGSAAFIEIAAGDLESDTD